MANQEKIREEVGRKDFIKLPMDERRRILSKQANDFIKDTSLEVKEWKQERPAWCHYKDCIFKHRCQDAFCGGELPEPAPHNEDFNYYRICLNVEGAGCDYLVNPTDLEHMRWIFDALDGKKTSWISRIGE